MAAPLKSLKLLAKSFIKPLVQLAPAVQATKNALVAARPQFIQKKVDRAIENKQAKQAANPQMPIPEGPIEHPVLAPDGKIYAITEDRLGEAVDQGGQIMDETDARRVISGEKSIGEVLGNQITEAKDSAGSWIGQKKDEFNAKSPIDKYTSVLSLPVDAAKGLLGMGAKALGGAAVSAGQTLSEAPDVLKTAYGTAKQIAQGGRWNDAYTGDQEASSRLQDTVQNQKLAVQNVAKALPLPGPQLAAGIQRSADQAADQGWSTKEALTRGVASGGLNALLSKPLIPGGKAILNKTKEIGQGGLNKISEMLQPQANNFEKKLAMSEDRFTSGNNNKFFGKKEATIAPSRDVLEAARTVNTEIKGAYKMKPEQLKKAAENKVNSLSKQLRPELDKVPITDEMKERMFDKYQKVKEALVSDVNFMHKASGKDILKTFEEKFLQPALERKNLGEFWDDRINLDNNKTIASKSIKNASELSEQYLKDQQEAWYALRNIFNDVIKDSDNVIGKASVRGKFKTLRDLMTARDNLINKAPDEFKKRSGPLSLRNIGITAATGVIGNTFLNNFRE